MTDTSVLDRFADIKVIDVDTHLTEPADLWVSRAPKEWKDRVPQVQRVDGKLQWFLDGKSIGPANSFSNILPDGSKVHGNAFWDWEIGDAHRGASEVKPRLEVMDSLGIWAQVVYPNLLGFGGQAVEKFSPDLRMMCATIFNDAMAEMQAESGDRLLPMAMMPWWDIKGAIAEMERSKGMGLRGINMNTDPQNSGMPDLADPVWDPFWQAASDLEMPIHFHIGASEVSTDWFGESPWQSQTKDRKLALGSAMMYLTNARVIGNLIYSGVLERYPRLKFVSVESGVGWIPFVLEALDYQLYENAESKIDDLSMKPSEYFKRQMYACYWFERQDLKRTISSLGSDNIMFMTDFPHPSCLYPNSMEFAAEGLADIDDATCRKVLSTNAAKLYKIALN